MCSFLQLKRDPIDAFATVIMPAWYGMIFMQPCKELLKLDQIVGSDLGNAMVDALFHGSIIVVIETNHELPAGGSGTSITPPLPCSRGYAIRACQPFCISSRSTSRSTALPMPYFFRSRFTAF